MTKATYCIGHFLNRATRCIYPPTDRGYSRQFKCSSPRVGVCYRIGLSETEINLCHSLNIFYSYFIFIGKRMTWGGHDGGIGIGDARNIYGGSSIIGQSRMDKEGILYFRIEFMWLEIFNIPLCHIVYYSFDNDPNLIFAIIFVDHANGFKLTIGHNPKPGIDFLLHLVGQTEKLSICPYTPEYRLWFDLKIHIYDPRKCCGRSFRYMPRNSCHIGSHPFFLHQIVNELSHYLARSCNPKNGVRNQFWFNVFNSNGHLFICQRIAVIVYFKFPDSSGSAYRKNFLTQ